MIARACLAGLALGLLPVAAPAQSYYPDAMHIVLGFTVEITGSGSSTDADSAWDLASGGRLSIGTAPEQRCQALVAAVGPEGAADFRAAVYAMVQRGLPRPSMLSCFFGAAGGAQAECPADNPPHPIAVCRAACDWQAQDARRNAIYQSLWDCANSPLWTAGAPNAGLMDSIFADDAPETRPAGETPGDRLLAEALGTCTPAQVESAHAACLAACDGGMQPVPVCAAPLRTLVVNGRFPIGR